MHQTADCPDIEVLQLADNRRMSVGEKRQALVDIARGRFWSMVDDDDMVAEDYVSTIRAALDADRDLDVICFPAILRVLGEAAQIVTQRLDLSEDTPLLRRPNQTCCWRRAFAQETGATFPSRDYGEDYAWASRVWPWIHPDHWVALPAPLYIYNHDPNVSLMQGETT